MARGGAAAPSSTRGPGGGSGTRVVSIAESTSARRARAQNVECCCCLAANTIVAISAFTFLLGSAVCLLGVFLQNSTKDWGVASIDVFGWICMVSGGFLTGLSLLGIFAARSGSTPMLFLYFLLLLLLLATMVLASIYGFFENERLTEYLGDNWDAIEANVGLGSVVGGDDDHLSLDEALELVRTYFLALAAVVTVAIGVLATAFVAVMRMLGVKAIVTCLLLMLGFFGAGEAAIAYETLREVPRATSWLLFGCAGTQLIGAVSGVCGFRWLNRECLCACVLVMLAATCALGYVATATYLWLRDTQPAKPENLLLIFAISAVADAYMILTLLFITVFYCRRRKAFEASERTNEMREEFSDYGTRDRPANRGRRRGNKPRHREYMPSDSL